MNDANIVTHSPAPQRRPSRLFGQFIVKMRFQFKFSLIVFIFLAVASLVIWVEGKMAVKHMVDTGMVTSEDAILQLQLLSGIIGKTSILALAIVFGLSLFFSHFVAGPIYRFERVLEDIARGNLTVIVRLRKHDEFKEVADLFNQALASLRNKLKHEREVVSGNLPKMKVVADALKQAGRDVEAAEVDRIRAELQNTPPQIHI